LEKAAHDVDSDVAILTPTHRQQIRMGLESSCTRGMFCTETFMVEMPARCSKEKFGRVEASLLKRPDVGVRFNGSLGLKTKTP